MNIQLASENDIFEICQLYFDVYEGNYPDPLMKDFNELFCSIQPLNTFESLL
jgi:hypothetical protein